MDSDFPSNSRSTPKKTTSPKDEEKKVAQVTTGEVVQRKKSRWKRFTETFISGADSKSVLEFVMLDILVPAAKDMVVDATQAGLERKFYGEARSAGRRGYGRGGGYQAYNRMGGSVMRDSVRGGRDEPRSIGPSKRARATHDFGEIILQTRVEATSVIDSLYELLSRFEVATVGDLYDLVGITPNYTDNRWGWVDLRGADVTRVRDGYLLELPRPEPLD